jgi:hypothetical protein
LPDAGEACHAHATISTAAPPLAGATASSLKGAAAALGKPSPAGAGGEGSIEGGVPAPALTALA